MPNAVFARLLESVSENNSAAVLGELDRLLGAGNSASQIARHLVRYLRNVLMARIAGEATELLQLSPDERARAAGSALLFGEEELTRFLQIMLRTFDELNYRQEQRFHLELGVLKLVHLQRLLPVEELLTQLGSPAGGGSLAAPRTALARQLTASRPLALAAQQLRLPSRAGRRLYRQRAPYRALSRQQPRLSRLLNAMPSVRPCRLRRVSRRALRRQLFLLQCWPRRQPVRPHPLFRHHACRRPRRRTRLLRTSARRQPWPSPAQVTRAARRLKKASPRQRRRNARVPPRRCRSLKRSGLRVEYRCIWAEWFSRDYACRPHAR